MCASGCGDVPCLPWMVRRIAVARWPLSLLKCGSLEYAQGFLGGLVILFTKGEVVLGGGVLGFQHGVEAAGGGCELSANVKELLDVAGLVVVAGAVVVGVDVGRFDGYVVLDFGGSFLPVLLGIVVQRAGSGG